MVQESNLDNKFDVIKIAVIIAIIFGGLLSVFFMVVQKDSYSSIYIIPGSIIYNPNESTVLYKYGVTSFESGNMDYTLDTYVNEKFIKTRQFSLNNGEILDEQDMIILSPDIQYPSKISLRLKTTTATEEVHFWLK
jgi:hypothetical protein